MQITKHSYFIKERCPARRTTTLRPITVKTDIAVLYDRVFMSFGKFVGTMQVPQGTHDLLKLESALKFGGESRPMVHFPASDRLFGSTSESPTRTCGLSLYHPTLHSVSPDRRGGNSTTGYLDP